MIKKEIHSFGLRYLLMNFLSMLPFIPVFIFMFIRASNDQWDWITFSLFGLFGMGACFGLWWQSHRSSRFVCPECNTLIIDRHENIKVGGELNFICKKCDIEWVTGLSHSSGD